MTVKRIDRSRLISVNIKKPVRKKEPDASHGTRKGPAAAQIWFGSEAKRWYILLGLSVIISILLFPSILTPPKSYRLGDVADRDIKASRDFLVEDIELTEKNRQEAVRAVLSVYDFDPTGTDIAAMITEAFESGRGYLAKSL
jgi:membrane-associated HD superfamily phosphohydrolase